MIKQENSFMGNSRLVLVALLFLLSGSCVDSGISNYKGDGEISKINGPLFGVSGYLIKLADFDLSKELHREFKLTGLPPARAPYSIFIVVNDSEMTPEVLLGQVDIIINNAGNTYRYTSLVKDMTNNAVSDENRFYFFDIYKLNLLNTSALSKNLSVTVNCENKNLKRSVHAKIIVRSGGSK